MFGRLVLLGCLCALACADGEAPDAIWCQAVCKARQRCVPTTWSEADCARTCVSNIPDPVTFSANGARAWAPCLETMSCSVFVDDNAWRTEVNACWEKAKLSVVVTPRVRRFCADYARLWFECGYSYSVEACEGDYAMWADAILDGLSGCVEVPTCDALPACAEEVFTRP